MQENICSLPFCFFLEVNELLLDQSPSVHCAVKVVRARFSLSPLPLEQLKVSDSDLQQRLIPLAVDL